MKLTIVEQSALIPRPKYKAVEVGSNSYRFNVASTAIKAVKQAEKSPGPVPVPTEPRHVGLLDLSDRARARLALKATWYDMRTFGRTNLYEQFKEKLQDERDAQAMVDLHIVDAVHCRLHENMIARAHAEPVE